MGRSYVALDAIVPPVPVIVIQPWGMHIETASAKSRQSGYMYLYVATRLQRQFNDRTGARTVVAQVIDEADVRRQRLEVAARLFPICRKRTIRQLGRCWATRGMPAAEERTDPDLTDVVARDRDSVRVGGLGAEDHVAAAQSRDRRVAGVHKLVLRHRRVLSTTISLAS